MGFLVELLSRSSFIFRSPFISWFFYFIGQTSFIKQRRGTFFKCPPLIDIVLFSFFICSHTHVSLIRLAFMFLSLSLQTVYGFDVHSFSIQGCLHFWCLLSSTSMLPVLWCLLSSTSRLPVLWYLLSSRLFALRFFAVLLSSYILFLIA